MGLRLALMLTVMACFWVYNVYFQPQRPAAAPVPEKSPAPVERPVAETSSEATPTANSLIVQGLVLRDERGQVLYRGNVDLAPTLARIAQDRRLRFANDGSTFQNREKRLPRKPSGYYREWVVPIPGKDGPGPQRLVTGKDGEVWYTSDHYRSFRRIPYTWPSS
jgi:guanyl-specific ribonuclease Sa